MKLGRDRGQKEVIEAEQFRGVPPDSSLALPLLKRKFFPPLALRSLFPFIFLYQNWNQGHVNFMISSVINSWVLYRYIFIYILL